MGAIEGHEDVLRAEIERGLGQLPGAVVHSRALDRTPTLLVTFEGRAAGDAYGFLAERGINAPAGSFYALEASRRLGLGDDGGLRIGLAPYSNAEDVARLLAGLDAFLT
jgi:selenocysteine lyase/cysteine desulfurase